MPKEPNPAPWESLALFLYGWVQRHVIDLKLCQCRLFHFQTAICALPKHTPRAYQQLRRFYYKTAADDLKRPSSQMSASPSKSSFLSQTKIYLAHHSTDDPTVTESKWTALIWCFSSTCTVPQSNLQRPLIHPVTHGCRHAWGCIAPLGAI